MQVPTCLLISGPETEHLPKQMDSQAERRNRLTECRDLELRNDSKQQINRCCSFFNLEICFSVYPAVSRRFSVQNPCILSKSIPIEGSVASETGIFIS
jgi:hypothetical protein